MVQFGNKSHHFGRISFQGLPVISKWMLLNLKSHFLARNNTVFAKRCFKRQRFAKFLPFFSKKCVLH